MKKVLNWTFGSVFRTFGRIIAYLLVGVLLGLILSKNDFKLPDIFSLLLFDNVKASTTNVNVNSHSYNIYYYNVDDNTGNVTEKNSGWFTGNFSNFSSGYNTYEKFYLQLTSDTLSYNQVYTINFSIWFTSRDTQSYYKALEYMILGSSNSAYSGATSENIQSYTCIATIPPDTATRVNFSCNVVPKYNINYLYIRAISSDGGEEITSIGTNTPTITYDNSSQATENAIHNQTTIIQNGNEQTQNIINNNFNELNENIDNTFNTGCSNELNLNRSWYGNTYSINNNSIVINSENWAFYTDFNVQKNTTYYFNFNSSNVSAIIQNNDGSVNLTDWKTSSFNFNSGNNSNIRILFNLSNVLNNSVTISNIMLSKKISIFCEYGSKTNKLDETNQSINDLNDSINNDDIGGATSEASDLFNNFTDSDFGLSGVITAPLNLIRSLTSKSCSQIVLPLPFVNENLTLPCLTNIYRENFSGILNIYQIVLFAIVGYRICVSIFFMVKGFKNPDEDRIEVLDL